MELKAAINRLVAKQDFTDTEMIAIMRIIMSGNATPAQIGAFLMGLRLKGETAEEIAAAASVMRELVTPVEVTGLPHLVDIVGTGGDGSATFNVSTASAIVAAAAGCHVAKHGNRSVSSGSGSADLLEIAGVCLDLTPVAIARCVRELGIGFMFAPMHHQAMRHAIGPRRELGVRTIFNILGPLTNPASVPNQLLGVFSPDLLFPMIVALQRLGSKHVLAVHGYDGVDEISIGAETTIIELQENTIKQYQITPEQFGIQRTSLTKLKVDSPAASLNMIKGVLANQPGPARDVVALNAGAAIYAAGVAATIDEGYAKALAVISNGQAQAKLDALIQLSHNLMFTKAAGTTGNGHVIT